jgi:hypothetical protein
MSDPQRDAVLTVSECDYLRWPGCTGWASAGQIPIEHLEHTAGLLA